MVDGIAERLEKIQKNYAKFESLAKKCGGTRQEAIGRLLDHYGQRFAMAPAASRAEHHSCFPGGLVHHSLKVFRIALKLVDVLGYDIPIESLSVCALFHDFGKVGTKDEDRYLEQTSQWHREHGMLYTTNPKVMFTHAQQSVFNLMEFGIALDNNEAASIYYHDGQYVEENRNFRMKDTPLSLVIHHADMHAVVQEKEEERANATK